MALVKRRTPEIISSKNTYVVVYQLKMSNVGPYLDPNCLTL